MVFGLSPTPQHRPARRSQSSVEPRVHRCLGCPRLRCRLRLDCRQRAETRRRPQCACRSLTWRADRAKRSRLLTPPPRRPQPRCSCGRGKGSAGRPLGGAPACVTRTIWRCPPQIRNCVVPGARGSERWTYQCHSGGRHARRTVRRSRLPDVRRQKGCRGCRRAVAPEGEHQESSTLKVRVRTHGKGAQPRPRLVVAPCLVEPHRTETCLSRDSPEQRLLGQFSLDGGVIFITGSQRLKSSISARRIAAPAPPTVRTLRRERTGWPLGRTLHMAPR
jgi:hypothetical protein